MPPSTYPQHAVGPNPSLSSSSTPPPPPLQGAPVSVYASAPAPPNRLAEHGGELTYLSRSANVVSAESIHLQQPLTHPTEGSTNANANARPPQPPPSETVAQQQAMMQAVNASQNPDGGIGGSGQACVISQTEGIKYDTYVANPTLPPPHISTGGGAGGAKPNSASVGDDSPSPDPAVNLSQSIPPSLYRPRILTVGGLPPTDFASDDETPQEWLDGKFKERGYSIANFSSLEVRAPASSVAYDDEEALPSCRLSAVSI